MSNNLASKNSFSDWFVQRAKYQGIFSKIQDFKKILGPPAPLSYHSHMTICDWSYFEFSPPRIFDILHMHVQKSKQCNNHFAGKNFNGYYTICLSFIEKLIEIRP